MTDATAAGETKQGLNIAKLLLGAAVGAVIGGGAVVFADTVRAARDRKSNDLGHDWPFARSDPAMAQALASLRAFADADPQAYYEMGRACDNMASLWYTLNDSSITPQHYWSYKSYRYREHVTKMLARLSKAALAQPRGAVPADGPRRRDARDRLQRIAARRSMDDFKAAADSLYKIVHYYHHNVLTDLQAFRGGESPEEPQQPQDQQQCADRAGDTVPGIGPPQGAPAAAMAVSMPAAR